MGPAGRGRANYSLNDPAPNDPALKGAIDMHAHQDPDSFGPSYGQAARSIDALDLYTRAKASGMRGFIIKGHLDQTAGLAYYMRKLHPDMEIFGGMGSNLTTGTKVNPWAITHMAEMKGGWGRIVWMPSWDSENSIHKLARRPPAYVAVAECKGLPFWINYPKPCPDGGELLPEVKEALAVIAKAKTRDSNGDLILATGHNSPPEVKLMVKEAVRVGVKHIIITHPLLDIVEMTPAEIKETVAMGPEIYAEFTSGFGNPNARPEVVKLYVGGHPRRGRGARVRVERHGAAQLELAARRAGQRGEGAARERVHRARARPAVQDQPGEDSRNRAASRDALRRNGCGAARESARG